MTEKTNNAVTGERIFFLDNLRTFMIFLVVLLHAGIVYESSGIPAFFWIVDDPATNDLSGLLNLVLDIFVMSIIFFISGYLAPVSLRSKSGWRFIKSKFKRLIVPWLVAVFTLVPLYKVIFLYSRGLPQEDWTTYFHWTNGIWNQNWLWFLPVLFFFDLAYVGLARMNWVPSRVSTKASVLVAGALAFGYTLFMQLFQLQGWTKTLLVDFQNERLLVYFLVFLVGSVWYHNRAFDPVPKSKKLYIAVSCVAWMPILLYLVMVLVAILKPGTRIISEFGDAVLMQGSFCVSLLCMLYLMVETFRYYLNRQGRVLRALSEASYGVYIVHVVILGVVAVFLMSVGLPSLLKHLILTVSTLALSTALVLIYRRVIRVAWAGRNRSAVAKPQLTQREVGG